MWKEYCREEIERDIGYATKLNLNALRIWLSYEYWQEEPELLKERFEHLLTVAYSQGIRIMPSLFECCASPQTRERLLDKNPLTAVAVNSPLEEVVNDASCWKDTELFVKWIMEHYSSDERLLAIEIINEPNTPQRFRFARTMVEIAAKLKGSIPITVGSIHAEENLYYLDLGIDIFQFHDNFPSELKSFSDRIQQSLQVADIVGKPIWITEWQRLRKGRIGWNGEGTDNEEWQPEYVTLANVVRESGIGHFFWSLMVKPAYLIGQRKSGTLNGVFHEDGSVWSLEDARAISGHAAFHAEENKKWPDWAKAISETYIKK